MQRSLLPPSPTSSQVVSALVKSIRLRKQPEAIAYLCWLWNVGGAIRARAQRRILIAAAEDNFSIPVMQAVAEWYCGKNRSSLHHAALAALQVMRTQNWYALPDGRDYIRAWTLADATLSELPTGKPGHALQALSHATQAGDLIDSLRWYLAFLANWPQQNYALIAMLSRLAAINGTESANQLSELTEQLSPLLGSDTNYTGQTLWLLHRGPVGPQELPVVTDAEAHTHLESQRARDSQVVVPDWALDGIHCGGKDPRFAGTLKYMAAACAAFESYGRLDPEDKWLPCFLLSVQSIARQHVT